MEGGCGARVRAYTPTSGLEPVGTSPVFVDIQEKGTSPLAPSAEHLQTPRYGKTQTTFADS